MDTFLLCVGIGVAMAIFAGTYVALGARGAMGRSTSRQSVIERWVPVAVRDAAASVTEVIRRRARHLERRGRALKEMPTFLDVVTLGLAAGLSFDASLELYCQRYDTALSVVFFQAMLKWRAGIQRRDEALHEVGERLNVMALKRFAAAVCQALAFGSPLAEALEQQAQAIRDEQRAEIEAEIERVPVKMLIPLGTLIVPAMLLSILGPLLGSSIGIG